MTVKNGLKFSRNDSGQEYHLTAYGKELVEAMPDGEKVKAVHRKYSRLKARLKKKSKGNPTAETEDR